MVKAKTYNDLVKDFEPVLHLLVRCLGCDKYLFSVYDPDIRDTCDECGGEPKIEYDLRAQQQGEE